MPKRLMRRFFKQAACERGKQVINRRQGLKLARQLANDWKATNRKAESLNA